MERINNLKNQIIHPNQLASFDMNYTWTMKMLDSFEFQNHGPLKAKTVVISGASRGIGLEIAKRCARDGANVAIIAKTVKPHPKLPGTIFTAAEDINQLGGKGLPIQCDLRNEQNVKEAVDKIVSTFGGIDILINNASAIALLTTDELPMKKYDLIHQINIRGTFMLTKYCLPHLKKSNNPHILNISPPLDIQQKWFKNHVAYSIGKYGMSFLAYGWAEEFKEHKIGVNCLWPRTTIATMAVQNEIGGEQMMKLSRKPDIMADAAHVIITSIASKTNANFFIDDHVLRSSGVDDLKKYQCDQTIQEHQLIPDFFC